MAFFAEEASSEAELLNFFYEKILCGISTEEVVRLDLCMVVVVSFSLMELKCWCHARPFLH